MHLVRVLATAAALATAYATTLEDVCTVSFAQRSLPPDSVYPGISIDTSSVTAVAAYNVSSTNQVYFPDATFDYCNMPAPTKFANRYLSTGGSGYDITVGSASLPGGVMYGAVAGTTDGGFGGFENGSDDVWLLANGTLNYDTMFMFGYQAIHELTVLGKELTKRFYNTSSIYSYYQGCSEGGRDGWSQIQRFAEDFDGAVTGAPGFRFTFQQMQHLRSPVVEQTLNYYPPPCELEKIVNETIKACDALDGKQDGVVSRTDLCKLYFDANSTIGQHYSCGASSLTTYKRSETYQLPAQNGTVSAKGVAVAKEILRRMHDLSGNQVYVPYQPSAAFSDAETHYDYDTDSWTLDITESNSEWVEKYINELNGTEMPTLRNVTYDDLKEWIRVGWQKYGDVLQSTYPDLTPFHQAGGKVLHYHGESDYTVPTASSVRYYESVRRTMYPDMSLNSSYAALGDWYRLFLVPGAAHCGPDASQPNGPWPQNTLETMIQWVEEGVFPEMLNATVLQGVHEGEEQKICAWPLRPLWTNNGTTMECVTDPGDRKTWLYDLNAFKMPVY
ncbi:tannase and feruloyl esterase [Aspergillus sclerotioniger CBS 115572]|uniref:Carboxylic ester hydrolase n=1 Tax=Aspergillus sclerotioniger CBS 115572 TaxID=1450535 RepID=A0A317X202_9EURO|nr:tannase and feruloyl esterase [Aspergillus sclerotioniger CBS 115572]PWY91632.1 tannase and feruloyl esterase [Aspergillus sclerotioniger CBS 115572]